MRKLIFLFLLGTFYISAAYAQVPLVGGERIDYYSSWTDRGAKVVPMGEIHLSALAKSRYGNYPKTELNSELLLFPLAPNIGFKHQWFGKNTILSSQHTFYYPTLGLKWAKSLGFKDQIPKTADIPHIFTFRNELILSRILNPQPEDCFIRTPDLVLTARVGFDFSLKTGDDNFPKLDYYFLYQRSASYYDDQKVYFAGLELAGNIYRNFNFSISGDYYNIDFGGEYAIESQGKIHWHKNSKFSVSAGYKTYYLNNDTKTQLFLMPVVDLVFKLNHRTKLQRGLFKK